MSLQDAERLAVREEVEKRAYYGMDGPRPCNIRVWTTVPSAHLSSLPSYRPLFLYLLPLSLPSLVLSPALDSSPPSCFLSLCPDGDMRCKNNLHSQCLPTHTALARDSSLLPGRLIMGEAFLPAKSPRARYDLLLRSLLSNL